MPMGEIQHGGGEAKVFLSPRVRLTSSLLPYNI